MWGMLAFLSTIPPLVSSTYIITGFDNEKYIQSMIVLPEHTLWFYIMSTYALSIFFLIYCIKTIIKQTLVKPKSVPTKAELHKLLMEGNLK